MKLILHIGAPKTATTTIQKFCHTNYDELLKYGVLYPKTGYGIMGHKFIYDSFNNDSMDDWILNLKKEIRYTRPKILIISDETLSMMFNMMFSIKKLKGFLFSVANFSSVEIVCYIREPFSLFCSSNSQTIKNKELVGPIDDFDKKTHWFWKIGNYAQIIKDYKEVFGDVVNVRLFDKNELVNDNIIDDFMSIVGINKENLKAVEDKNKSLNLLGQALLTHINKHSMTFLGCIHTDLYLFVEKHLCKPSKRLKFLPPKDKIDEIFEYFKDSHEWVRKNYFPHKKTLFKEVDFTNYVPNVKLDTLLEEDWETIGAFIADIFDTKNKQIIKLENQVNKLKNKLGERPNTIISFLKSFRIIFNMKDNFEPFKIQSSQKLYIDYPSWLAKDEGCGCIISNTNEKEKDFKISFKSPANSILNITFRGGERKDEFGVHMPLWINFKDVKINEKSYGDFCAWYGKTKEISLSCKKDELITISFELGVYKFSKEELKQILSGIYGIKDDAVLKMIYCYFNVDN